MSLATKRLRSVVTFKSDEEARAWSAFAAAASVNLAGEGDEVKEDADDASDFADEMLKRYRERQP